MAEGGGLVHWQAKLGMGLIGTGSVGLFSMTKGWLTLGGDAMSYILIVLALVGVLMLMLSMGIESDSEELSQTFTMMEEEEESKSYSEGEE